LYPYKYSLLLEKLAEHNENVKVGFTLERIIKILLLEKRKFEHKHIVLVRFCVQGVYVCELFFIQNQEKIIKILLLEKRKFEHQHIVLVRFCVQGCVYVCELFFIKKLAGS
jgi:hypothetical protein